jgi:hypothetical protein
MNLHPSIASPRTRRRHSSGRPTAAFTIPELLIYIVSLLAVSAVAFTALNRMWSATGRMAATADDSTACLRAGERWRHDLRAASTPPRIEENGSVCILQSGSQRVAWFHFQGRLWRQAGSLPAAVWCERVESCRFTPDPRKHVPAHRLELALFKRSPRSPLPLQMDFVAVPTATIAP